MVRLIHKFNPEVQEIVQAYSNAYIRGNNRMRKIYFIGLYCDFFQLGKCKDWTLLQGDINFLDLSLIHSWKPSAGKRLLLS